jgi:hypothetical protein
MSRPFRWDVRHREQLGGLVPEACALPGHMDELRLACARVVARAGDAELVFVGRSLENMFDYLGGVLADTSWAERPRLLSISLWSMKVDDLSTEQIAGFRAHARVVGIDPAAIVARAHATAFVDVIASGGTMAAITTLLVQWARDERVDVRKLRERLRFVGLTRRTKTSPNTWRWHQHALWAKALPPSAFKNVSLPPRLWRLLADEQPKVSRRHPPSEWSLEQPSRATHDPPQLEALALARTLYEVGLTRPERESWSARLAREPCMRWSWCRALVGEVRGRSVRR